MAEVKLRLNLETEEVELVVDGQVALTSGKDVLHSWVEAVNSKNKPAEVPDPPVVPEPVEEKKVTPEGPAEETPKEVVAEVDNSSEPVVD